MRLASPPPARSWDSLLTLAEKLLTLGGDEPPLPPRQVQTGLPPWAGVMVQGK